MKILIEVNCDNAAFEARPYDELARILGTVPGKVRVQLARNADCICDTLESADKLMDINGNTVGSLEVIP